MQRFSKFNRATLALLAAAVIVGAVPASAQVGMGEDSSSGSSSTGSATTAQSAKQKAEQAREAAREAQKQANEAKKTAQEATKEARDASKAGKAKTAEQLQKRCQSIKSHATSNFKKMSHGATNVLTRIDTIYEQAQIYQTTNNLNPAGINDLITTANANKISATQAVTTLENTTPSMDCNSSGVASDLAKYRKNVQGARDKLKEYRSSVKTVLHALKDAKTSTSPEGIVQ